MGLPDFRQDGLLPAGIHAATLQEVQTRFGSGSEIRQRKQQQLVKVVQAALAYITIKRVFVVGQLYLYEGGAERSGLFAGGSGRSSSCECCRAASSISRSF